MERKVKRMKERKNAMKKDYLPPEVEFVSFEVVEDLMGEPGIDPSIIPVPDD